jgi:hypothetical protein
VPWPRANKGIFRAAPGAEGSGGMLEVKQCAAGAVGAASVRREMKGRRKVNVVRGFRCIVDKYDGLLAWWGGGLWSWR